MPQNMYLFAYLEDDEILLSWSRFITKKDLEDLRAGTCKIVNLASGKQLVPAARGESWQDVEKVDRADEVVYT